MWNVMDQTTVASKCRIPQELTGRLGKASDVFGVPEEEIIAQALREFFEKHGIRGQKIPHA